MDRSCKKKFKRIAAELKRYQDLVQIVAVPRVTVPVVERKRVRADFESGAKNSFFKVIAQTEKETLNLLFGLNDDDLHMLQTSGLAGHHTARHRMRSHSVDHILPIWLGGKNDISNLCLMPASLNGMKATFEELQKNAAPKGTSILTFMPLCNKNGAYHQIIPSPL